MSVAINHESFSSIEPSLAEVCCQKGCNLSRRKESRLHTFFLTQVRKEYLCLAQGARFEIPTFLGDTTVIHCPLSPLRRCEGRPPVDQGASHSQIHGDSPVSSSGPRHRLQRAVASRIPGMCCLGVVMERIMGPIGNQGLELPEATSHPLGGMPLRRFFGVEGTSTDWSNLLSSGWWFGTGSMFHILGIIAPADELHHFSEG